MVPTRFGGFLRAECANKNAHSFLVKVGSLYYRSLPFFDLYKMLGTKKRKHNILPNGGRMIKNPVVKSLKKSPTKQIQERCGALGHFWMGHMQFLVYPFRRRSGVVKVSGSQKNHMKTEVITPKWKGTSSSKFRFFWAIWSNKANLARIPLPAYLLGWAASAEVDINCLDVWKKKTSFFFQKGGACSALFGLLKVLNGRLSKSMVNER